MNEKVLKKLEFDKVIDKLVSFASGREAKELCADMSPIKDISELERLQQENEDDLNRIFKKLNVTNRTQAVLVAMQMNILQ